MGVKYILDLPTREIKNAIMSEIKTPYLAQYITEHVSNILSWSAQSSQLFQVQDLVDWYMRVPHSSTFRVNTVKHTIEAIVTYLQQTQKEKHEGELEVLIHGVIPECVIVSKINTKNLDVTMNPHEVIVDAICGVAVLRGSNVFAPGVLSMTPKTNVGSKVSVFADLSGTCLRGAKQFSNDGKLFLGNGIVRQNRFDIFESGKKPQGVAIEITDPVSGIVMPECPSYLGVLQNLPSMVCVRVLDPKPGETILDMCAAPGNKTTHIATLMNDEGILIAVDRKSKIEHIVENCSKLGIRNCVHVFAGDSTKIVGDVSRSVVAGPPFPPESFDRILLDAACSGSGNRPMLKNFLLTEKTTRSFSKIQRSFVTNAVSLLKRGGILVYSTCSILCEENECVIAWLLEKYPQMELIEAVPVVGSPGLPNCNLDAKQRSFVQRFGPGTQSNNSIGFFIAALRKK